jgi:hypothetical protein
MNVTTRAVFGVGKNDNNNNAREHGWSACTCVEWRCHMKTKALTFETKKNWDMNFTRRA